MKHKASIITIGDEILIGQITDTNSTWLADKLYHSGFEVNEIRSIKDKNEDIQKTLKDVIPKNNLVIITGGLGPTNDDITKVALNDYFGGQLVMNEEVLDDIKDFIVQKRGYLSLTENNRAQALVSDKCRVLRNPVGTAPVQLFTKNNTLIISLPGVPFEMKHLFNKIILPDLKKSFNLSENTYRTYHIVGYPESELANTLNDWESDLEESIKVAYLPSPGVIRLRISEENNRIDILNKQAAKLSGILGKSIVAQGKEKVEYTLGKILTNSKMSISTAESCTGGLMAHRISSVAGASEYFKGGITAYSNEVKENQLKVNGETLKRYGAVSKQTAEEMAIGAAKLLSTDISLATTGIAGPTGGTPEKPVGTLWVAIYIKGEVYTNHFRFTHDRSVNIERAATVTMYELLKKLI